MYSRRLALIYKRGTAIVSTTMERRYVYSELKIEFNSISDMILYQPSNMQPDNGHRHLNNNEPIENLVLVKNLIPQYKPLQNDDLVLEANHSMVVSDDLILEDYASIGENKEHTLKPQDQIVENDDLILDDDLIIDDDLILEDENDDFILEDENDDLILDDENDDLILDDDLILEEEESSHEDDEGVIYKLTDKRNGKIYIGKTKKRLADSSIGVNRRFHDHLRFSNSETDVHRNDCPYLYAAMKGTKETDWEVEVLKVCSMSDRKMWETKLITEYKSYDSNVGYNYFVGDNCPADPERRKHFKENKARCNTNRALNGKLKRKTSHLPTYITEKYNKTTKRVNGYRVAVKINGEKYDISFMTEDDNLLPFKLEEAKAFLNDLLSQRNNIQ